MNPTREMILQKAFMLFIQHGYEGMSMHQLQEETNLSRGALYHHFKGKEQLFTEVLETFYIAAPTTPSQPLDVSTLLGFYRGYHEHTIKVFTALRQQMNGVNSENDFNLFSLGLDAMKRYPGFRDKMRHINEEVHKIWVSVVRNARATGEIRSEMTDDHIAGCFFYLSEGIGTRYTLEGRGVDAGDELIRLWDAFYGEIKTKSSN